ncbi:hypothetical protein GCM10027290_61940 [Micromonospora sonneratiae]|uniref:Uncharacterized protein n=1 Tax=Micromonospora sonneratiae TaxID=1184706 RepID=A0ABW3YMP5_9ACTN
MLTDQQAIDRAFAYLTGNRIVGGDVRLAVKSEWIKRVPGAVVVGYNSARFVETGDPAVTLLGNMPIRVEESTGECRELGISEYFDIYQGKNP